MLSISRRLSPSLSILPLSLLISHLTRSLSLGLSLAGQLSRNSASTSRHSFPETPRLSDALSRSRRSPAHRERGKRSPAHKPTLSQCFHFLSLFSATFLPSFPACIPSSPHPDPRLSLSPHPLHLILRETIPPFRGLLLRDFPPLPLRQALACSPPAAAVLYVCPRLLFRDGFLREPDSESSISSVSLFSCLAPRFGFSPEPRALTHTHTRRAYQMNEFYESRVTH